LSFVDAIIESEEFKTLESCTVQTSLVEVEAIKLQHAVWEMLYPGQPHPTFSSTILSITGVVDHINAARAIDFSNPAQYIHLS
jgi:hypothetical protein